MLLRHTTFLVLILSCSASPRIPHLPTHPSFGQTLSTRSLSARNNRGLTLSICRDPRSCLDGRRCLRLTQFGEGTSCTTDWICICVPDEFTKCSSSADCVEGEFCAETLHTVGYICVAEAGPTTKWIREVPGPSEEEAQEVSPPPIAPQGLTMEPCRDDADCKGERSCQFYGLFRNTSPSKTCDAREPCYCLPSEILPCFDPVDCEAGEICAETSEADMSACISEQAVGIVVGMCPVQFTGTPLGFNFDSCTTSDDCQGTRVCGQWKHFPPDLLECEGKRPCACLPRSGLLCEATRDCDEGEVCSKYILYGRPVCVSTLIEQTFFEVEQISAGTTPTPRSRPQPSPSRKSAPDGNEEGGSAAGSQKGACVDARALRHLKPHELVFKTHVRSEVLCDGNENCATEGHMIVFRGKAMMMRSYCKLTRCIEREMLVNSPKFKMGMRVASNSDSFQYTALAARYSTIVEERILAAAVRIAL